MADYRDASYSNQNQMGWGEDFNQDPVDNSDGKMLSRESRTGFIRKVYLILATQMTVTTIFVVASVVSESFKHFIANHFGL
jgi:FtsH-binding integral membrane protein